MTKVPPPSSTQEAFFTSSSECDGGAGEEDPPWFLEDRDVIFSETDPYDILGIFV